MRPAKKVTSKTVPSKMVTFKNVTTHTLLLEGHSEFSKELTSNAARSAIIERAPRDNFCEGRQAPSECDGFEGHESANELCAADHARVLLPNLLTPAGLRPLLDLILQHGPRAMQVVRATLTKAAIDGWPRNKIKTWAYFLPELASEAEAEEREAGGIRPGDVLGSWRDRPMDSDISEASGRPPEHSPAAEAHLEIRSKRQERRWHQQRPQCADEWRKLLRWLFSDAGRPWNRAVYGQLPGEPGCWVPRVVLDEFGGRDFVGENLAPRAIAKGAQPSLTVTATGSVDFNGRTSE